jgi:hypothetical protein
MRLGVDYCCEVVAWKRVKEALIKNLRGIDMHQWFKYLSD